MTSSEVFDKRDTVDQKPGPGLARNQDFVKGERLLPKVKKLSENVQMGRRGEQTRVTQAYY